MTLEPISHALATNHTPHPSHLFDRFHQHAEASL
jgi:hypothetical protein